MLRKGRWASQGAMRVYLDQVGALVAEMALDDVIKREMQYKCAHLLEVFPELGEGLLKDASELDLPAGESASSLLDTARDKRTHPAHPKKRNSFVAAWW